MDYSSHFPRLPSVSLTPFLKPSLGTWAALWPQSPPLSPSTNRVMVLMELMNRVFDLWPLTECRFSSVGCFAVIWNFYSTSWRLDLKLKWWLSEKDFKESKYHKWKAVFYSLYVQILITYSITSVFMHLFSSHRLPQWLPATICSREPFLVSAPFSNWECLWTFSCSCIKAVNELTT